MRKGLRSPQLLLAAGLLACTVAAQGATSSSVLSVSATVLSRNNCKFQTNSLALSFLTIDPSATTAKTATAAVKFVCNGSSASASYFVTAGDGLHATGSGARRMRHTAVGTEFLPYSLTWTPGNGLAPKGVEQTLTFSGSVAPADFQSARSGGYSDTVIITIAP